jgi:hypothetical protein
MAAAMGYGQRLQQWETLAPLQQTIERTLAMTRSGCFAEPSAAEAEASLGTLLSDVAVEDVQWLWRGRIALGKLTMLDGDPGLGKSLVTLDLAARVAMGRSMPDGSPGLVSPAGVILICGEDGLSDTVKPRLLAAGASPQALARVRAIDLVPETLADGTTAPRLLSLLADLPRLEATIAGLGARLVIIDPITAYLGSGVDMYRDSDLRRVLTPLAALAERAGVAIALVRHLTKNSASPALHRGLGGVGFIGVARFGLLFAPNPDVEGEVLVSRHKGNVGRTPPTLAYCIMQVGEAENMPHLTWLGERETTAGMALAAQSSAVDGAERSATEEAVAWLHAQLVAGAQLARTVYAQARAEGISEKALRTARLRICRKPKKGGMAEGWQWELDPAKAPFQQGEGIFGEGKATNPQMNGAAPKMPLDERDGRLRRIDRPKMPFVGVEGHLRTNAEFKPIDDPFQLLLPPKMPSPSEKGAFAARCLCGSAQFARYGDELRCHVCDRPSGHPSATA